MRPTISSAAARDVSQLCARCRLQARRASFLASPPLSRPTTVPNSTKTPYPSSSSPLHKSAFSTARPHTSDPISELPSSNPQTLYDIFPETLPSGPPPTGHFPIDTRALRREFLKLQARAHPDMHPGPLKARAEATSALINEAYKTLSNPLLRAQYLLSLRGVDVANDETLKVEDTSLLMLVLEAHEEITEARSEEDLRELRDVNDERIRRSEEVLEGAFREDDVEMAKREAVKLRYWVNIRESLNNWEEGRPVVLEH